MKHVLSQKEIGQRIRRIRENSGIRVIDIAKALKVTRQHVYSIERGQRGISVHRLQQLSRFLNVDSNAILEDCR